MSALTSDIMASIAQRASQLHQQSLYKTTPLQQIHPQQQVLNIRPKLARLN